ncbi:MAG: histidinol-phosphate transaminase [Candidatus Neomarinimicrobiota bacterium]|jgi:histidinol-phosphate aminotransferase|nr:histidinol-phosphate transaminase [Candidatus Neomarinimicrobiota bacterium]MDD3966075.1 histidinol-phosphate transaminase [Candidatus Neomarinimicrobiota bacterium]MDX9780367.1 histidinol-phosphate transaminase [bacterium]
MTFELESLVRKNILGMMKYASARDEFSGKAKIFLDANENSYGSPAGGALNRYPDPLQRELRKKIAEERGIAREEQIFLGNGSDEAIDLLMRVFGEPRIDSIMVMPPTYGMYKVCADINDLAVLQVSLRPDYSLDTELILKTAAEKKPKLIFICSPNNPSANLMDTDSIRRILDESNAIVVVDEAYIDFADAESWTKEIDAHPNLVVLQTFSKAWGMAALRLGMAFASPEIVALMNKIKYPYNISDLTAKTVISALRQTREKEHIVRQIKTERSRLMTAIADLPFVKEVLPSAANFFLVRFTDAAAVYRYLREKGVIVRDRSGQMHCRECLRITVGTPDENRFLCAVLEDFGKEMAL